MKNWNDFRIHNHGFDVRVALSALTMWWNGIIWDNKVKWLLVLHIREQFHSKIGTGLEITRPSDGLREVHCWRLTLYVANFLGNRRVWYRLRNAKGIAFVDNYLAEFILLLYNKILEGRSTENTNDLSKNMFLLISKSSSYLATFRSLICVMKSFWYCGVKQGEKYTEGFWSIRDKLQAIAIQFKTFYTAETLDITTCALLFPVSWYNSMSLFTLNC